MTTNPVDRFDWVPRPELDLFSAANLSCVQAALSNPSAVVFGWHYHYKGGTSRSIVAFTDFDEYLRYVERARPGDHFTSFELDALLELAVVHVGDIQSTHGLSLDGSTPVIVGGRRRSVQDVLADENAEVLLIRRFSGMLTGTTDVALTELPGTGDERRIAFGRELGWGRGELIMFDQWTLDEDVHGEVVDAVTPDRTRVHALADVKRPSLEGTVPLNGPY